VTLDAQSFQPVPEGDSAPAASHVDGRSDAPTGPDTDNSSCAAVDGAVPPATRPSPPPPRRSAVTRQTSAPAIAATVALVMFSVFIGLYGPRLGNRQQLPGGTTLVELAAAIEPRHAQRVIGVLQEGTEGIALLRRARGSDALAKDARVELEQRRQRAEEAIGRILNDPIALPVPADARVLWAEPERVRLPGAGGALVSCMVLPDARNRALERYATILLLKDEDRFTVFDSYGRPRPLPEGEVFSVVGRTEGDPQVTDLGDGGVQVVRCGATVIAVQASDATLTTELIALLEESLARSAAATPRP